MGWSPLEAHSLRLRCHLRGNFSAKQDTQSDPAYIVPVYFFILAKQSIGNIY